MLSVSECFLPRSRPYLCISKSASPDSRNVCVCYDAARDVVVLYAHWCGSAPFVQLTLGVYSRTRLSGVNI